MKKIFFSLFAISAIMLAACNSKAAKANMRATT